MEALYSFKRKLSFALARCRPKTVLISELHCQRLPYSELQGFSGKPIEFFPPTSFFKIYLENPEAGFEHFCEWYREWFIRKQAWKIPKREGGMSGGSLVKNLAKIYLKQTGSPLSSPEDAAPQMFEEAIQIRVRYFLDLFRSIQQRGFIRSFGPPIYCHYEDGIHYIYNGHHRVAAMSVLQHREAVVHLLY